MKNKILILITCVLIFAVLSGCTTGSYLTVGSIQKNTSSSMSMSYYKFDGHKSTKIHVKEGEVIEVNVDIVTTKGKIDLSIVDEKEQSVYQGTDIPTSTFIVSLDKAGDYELTVNAENHKGSYKISWGKSEQK